MSDKATTDDDRNESDMLNQFLAEVQDRSNTAPLQGWSLLAQDVALDEAERERLLQEIPYFREQAVQTIAYWMSLSRRIDALTRTRQLLAHMPVNQARDTSAPSTSSRLPEHD